MSSTRSSTRRKRQRDAAGDSSDVSVIEPTSQQNNFAVEASEDRAESPPLQNLPAFDASSDRGSQRQKERRQPNGSETSSPLKYGASTPRSKATGDGLWSRSSADGGSRAGPKTPRRFRPDLNATIDQVRTVRLDDVNENLEAEHADRSAASEGRQAGARVFVWGTRICVTDVQDSFNKFLTEFTDVNLDDDELVLADMEGDGIDRTLPYYLQRLQEIFLTEDPHMNVNLQHVKQFNDALYRQIVCYPADIIPYLDFVANNVFEERFNGAHLPYQIQIRPFNADRTRNMRDLNPEDIDQLITVNGMIIRTSPLIPEMRQGFFECAICNNSMEVDVDRGRIEEPTLCQNCNISHTFQLIHNRSLFMDKQIIKLQESPDDMPAGQTPHTVTVYSYGDLVDTVQPGDRVTVTGIYRAIPLRINPHQRTVKAVYKTYVDVLHFRKTDMQRLHAVDDGTKLAPERIRQIEALAKKPDIVDRLAHALAPSIYEHDDIKKGILCLLFGGTKKDFSKSGKGHFRSEINVLLCGDPGTSKSQLLQYVHHLMPRGQYTSGKGSSAVGLTAYVTRDPETKYFVLQTGALVLSDNGVCCIDEFDKMSDGTRSVLHEVMEQQTLSIAKAGIICQLNARTSILAAANPVDSQWNKNKTIIENVQLPHTLLSRFDLIFLMVDPQDEYYDRRLATHLVSLYYRGEDEEESEHLDMAMIRDYIAYAKLHCHPKLTEEAGQNLIEKYVKMRQVGSGRGQVSAYPRQLESLIRLAEAHAKIHFSETVSVEDVEEAYRLHREALKQSAVDPLTGKVDVNILAAGMSVTTRKHMLELADVIKRTVSAKPFGTWFNLKKLLYDIRENSDRMITREMFEEAISELCKNDVIMRGREGQIRLSRHTTMETGNEENGYD